MPYYISCEHKFAPGDVVKLKNDKFVKYTIMNVMAERHHPENYSPVIINYYIRDHTMRPILVLEHELEEIKQEEVKNEVENMPEPTVNNETI